MRVRVTGFLLYIPSKIECVTKNLSAVARHHIVAMCCSAYIAAPCFTSCRRAVRLCFTLVLVLIIQWLGSLGVFFAVVQATTRIALESFASRFSFRDRVVIYLRVGV